MRFSQMRKFICTYLMFKNANVLLKLMLSIIYGCSVFCMLRKERSRFTSYQNQSEMSGHFGSSSNLYNVLIYTSTHISKNLDFTNNKTLRFTGSIFQTDITYEAEEEEEEMEIDTEDSDTGEVYYNNLDTDSEEDSLDLGEGATSPSLPGVNFGSSLHYSSRASFGADAQSEQTMSKRVCYEPSHVTHTSPRRDEQRVLSPPPVTRVEPRFSTPVQESTREMTVHVLRQDETHYTRSLFGEEYSCQDTPVAHQASQVTRAETQRHSMTSDYWSGGVQEQGNEGSVMYHLGSDPPPQTGVFVDTHRLQQGQGRPPLDATKCAYCKQRTVGVSQRPCGHIVCVTCQPPYMGDKCKICNQEVESVVAYDGCNLQRH